MTIEQIELTGEAAKFAVAETEGRAEKARIAEPVECLPARDPGHNRRRIPVGLACSGMGSDPRDRVPSLERGRTESKAGRTVRSGGGGVPMSRRSRSHWLSRTVRAAARESLEAWLRRGGT